MLKEKTMASDSHLTSDPSITSLICKPLGQATPDQIIEQIVDGNKFFKEINYGICSKLAAA